jgi:hypothetical protein
MLADVFGFAAVVVLFLCGVTMLACLLQHWSQSSVGTNISEAAPVPISHQYRFLSDEDRDNFSHLWCSIQQRAGDDAEKAIRDADILLSDLRQDYGGDTELEANYAAAHVIAVRVKQGDITAEEIQRALDLYEVVFGEILGYSGSAGPFQKKAA